jgi:hypothetical protein
MVTGLLDGYTKTSLRFFGPSPQRIRVNNRRAFILLLMLVVAGCATAPIQEMSDARQAIAAAQDAEAASVPLDDAQRLLSEAEAQIRSGYWGMARANAIRARDLAVNALNAIQGDPQN